MLLNRVMRFKEKFIETVRKFWGIVGVGLSLLTITGLMIQLGLSRFEVLQVFTLFGLLILGMVAWSGFTSLEERLESLGERLEEISGVLRGVGMGQGGSEYTLDGAGRKEEEEKTSGLGAFGGMIVGGLLGLAFGPEGVIIGGLIGSILGDLWEREEIKERKKRLKRRRQRP